MHQKHPEVHLINKLPHIYETEDLIKFCRANDKLYIYGIGEVPEYICTFLNMNGIEINGYVISDRFASQRDGYSFIYKEFPIFILSEISSKEKAGVILGMPESSLCSVVPVLRELPLINHFILTEYSRLAIAHQLKPRTKETMTIEVNICDHCNFDCQMCDHYSQLSEPKFIDVAIYERDIKRMAELFNREMGCITLLGGEPLLHDNIIQLVEITRREFPATQIIILTNGLRLLQLENSKNGNLWQSLKDNDINVTVTVYPINLDYDAILEKAKEYGVSIGMSSNIHAEKLTREVKISCKHTFDVQGNVPNNYFISCLYFNKFAVLKDGKVYLCPICAHIGIFNQYFDQHLEHVEGDSIDIFEVNNYQDIIDFTSRPAPFCRYCDLKNWTRAGEFQRSKKQLSEYV